ncbi:hypothetical protein [Streptomyces sp. NPDC054834]
MLTVGWWLRDFDTLDAVHDLLHHRHGEEIELTVVTRQATSRCWPPVARILEGVSQCRDRIGSPRSHGLRVRESPLLPYFGWS